MLHPEHQQLTLALAQCLAELGRQNAAVGVMRRLLAESELLEDGLMINVQFHAAGYQLMGSEELKSLAQRWEAQKQSEGVGPLWADQSLQTPTGAPTGWLLLRRLCQSPGGALPARCCDNTTATRSRSGLAPRPQRCCDRTARSL